MSWIISGVMGLIAGAIARLLFPGKENMGWIMTMVLGIAGSMAATWAGRALGLYAEGAAAGFIGSVVGALVLLFIYSKVAKKA